MRNIFYILVFLSLSGFSQSVHIDGPTGTQTDFTIATSAADSDIVIIHCPGAIKVITSFNYLGSLGARLGAYIPEDSTLSTSVGVDTWTFLGAGAGNKFVNIHSSADFGFTGDTLQYVGEHTIFLYIEYGGAVECNTNAETVHFTMFIGGVEKQQFTGSTYCKTAGEEYPIAGVSNIVEINTNDLIKIMIKSDSETTITNDHFSVAAHKIN